MIETNPLKTYPGIVAALREAIRGDAALEAAVGGDFVTVGKLEFALLQGLGLGPGQLVVDVGCGSGRLAVHLSTIPTLRYIGTDIVGELLAHAEKLTRRADWKFILTDGVKIPCADDSADFVCFFSVFTHLTHEDSYRYLSEARRALKPGGRVVFSFLEFHIYSHWSVFETSLAHGGIGQHLNQFMSRDAIASWAHHLNMTVDQIHDGDKPHIEIAEDLTWHDGRVMSGKGCLGQSVAVLVK
jgi:ubiquinone/menaquinone biosynthesis C-methylase UbiE